MNHQAGGFVIYIGPNHFVKECPAKQQKSADIKTLRFEDELNKSTRDDDEGKILAPVNHGQEDPTDRKLC